MSVSQYIGQFKVTAAELGIARNSCPNSVYSSNLIFGGRADDETLGYKDYQSPIVNIQERLYKQGNSCTEGYVEFPQHGCIPDQGSDEKNIEYAKMIDMHLANQDKRKGDPVGMMICPDGNLGYNCY
jgi:hypothetical protein